VFDRLSMRWGKRRKGSLDFSGCHAGQHGKSGYPLAIPDHPSADKIQRLTELLFRHVSR
jgi:hypothetical protein